MGVLGLDPVSVLGKHRRQLMCLLPEDADEALGFAKAVKLVVATPGVFHLNDRHFVGEIRFDVERLEAVGVVPVSAFEHRLGQSGCFPVVMTDLIFSGGLHLVRIKLHSTRGTVQCRQWSHHFAEVSGARVDKVADDCLGDRVRKLVGCQ